MGKRYYYGEDHRRRPIPDPEEDPEEFKVYAKLKLKRDSGISFEQTESMFEAEAKKRDLLVTAFKALAIERKKGPNANPYSAKAYTTAAKIISQLKTPVISGKALKGYKGIGPKIAAKIDEILATGTVKELEDRPVAVKKEAELLQTFTKVWGVGPAKAKAWIAKGYTSMKDVSRKEKLTTYQRVWVKHHRDLAKPIPRKEVTAIGKQVIDIVKKLDPKATAEIAGSYRRGSKFSGDVDVLISSKKLYDMERRGLVKILDHLPKKFVIDRSAVGKQKFMGVVKIKDRVRRLDFLVMPPSEYPTAILFFTGSGEFNQKMRSHAKKLGFKLSEKGLFELPQNKRVKGLKTEKDIFKAIDFPYRKPQDRNVDSPALKDPKKTAKKSKK